MSEFDLIATYFTWENPSQYSSNTSDNTSSNIIKNVGDDAAVLSLAPNQQLVTSIDTLVSGVHFPSNTSPYDIGHKALAVNLSDLAAMGSKPEWFTLALTLPEINHKWLSEFSRGLKTLAEEAGISLVGGDTTSGPLAISIQVMGSVTSGKALYRNGAKQGDKIYVSGTLGDGAVGLALLQKTLTSKTELTETEVDYCQQRLNRPTARLNESDLIKDYASACIDISDGLLQDLSHILKQSTLSHSELNSDQIIGAELDLTQIPFSKVLKKINNKQALEFALTGGDDYELLFTIPEIIEAEFLETYSSSECRFSCIGTITNQKGIIHTNNNSFNNLFNNSLNNMGFNHFS
ncbi:MAG: thiamine-phosphate kinase [Cocleimonas sp.]